MPYLKNKEKAVMAGLYKLGKTTVSSLAKETLINRTTLYPILDKLLKRGLALEIKAKGRTLVEAASFKDFKKWVERRKKRAERQADEVMEWIADKEKSAGTSSPSEVYYYNGAEAIKSLCQEAGEPGASPKEFLFVDKLKNLDIKINIHESKLIMINFEKNEPWGLVIKNHKIIKAFKNIFEYLRTQEKKP